MNRFIYWIVACFYSYGIDAIAPSAWADAIPVAPAAGHVTFAEDETQAGLVGIREHIEAVIGDAVTSYLQTSGVREQGLGVTATPVLDQQGKVVSLDAQITITTDIEHPEQIGREARQAVQRALIDDGYRFELPGIDNRELSSEERARPLAKIMLTIAYPTDPRGWTERLALKPILVFLTIICLMLIGLYLCIWMSTRLWQSLRRRQIPATNGADPQTYEGAAAFPAENRILPPLPHPTQRNHLAVDVLPPPASLPIPGCESDLPPVPGAILNSPDGPEKQALIASFAEMPFEKAVRALSALDAASRTAIIDKLGWHISVRRRIEQEVAELTRS